MTFIIAVGVNSDGRREVLGMEVGTSEAEPIWTEFLRKLTRRGLRGVIHRLRPGDGRGRKRAMTRRGRPDPARGAEARHHHGRGRARRARPPEFSERAPR
ncbi:transposase (fragment) [Mesorhizobium plurifarium]|uniref:Transposase n=1 Tax=Mesorhizobium plurifarium TaxID=69974 RepID=A0A090E1F9_MESPL